jgi:hypothetical protein
MKEKDAFIEQIKKELEECNDETTDIAHRYADDLLCKLLEYLGHKDIVQIYENIDKWYD